MFGEITNFENETQEDYLRGVGILFHHLFGTGVIQCGRTDRSPSCCLRTIRHLPHPTPST